MSLLYKEFLQIKKNKRQPNRKPGKEMSISSGKKKHTWQLKGQRKGNLESLMVNEMQMLKQENTVLTIGKVVAGCSYPVVAPGGCVFQQRNSTSL